MTGNSCGKAFKISTFGESHGVAIGVNIEGCPAGLDIDLSKIQEAMDRRKPGQSAITTQRKEADVVEILSGIFEGKTTGAPIALLIKNKDQRSKDYGNVKDTFRPSHADFTYQEKYNNRDYRGGGRSSARETATRVAAGNIALQFLQAKVENLRVEAYVSQVGNISVTQNYQELDLSQIENTIVRCPDIAVANKMIEHIETIRDKGDTVGGVITCVVRNCPVGLGEPVFDKLHAELGKAMLSINAVKGFEYGSGFEAASMYGSAHNDSFVKDDNEIKTTSNFSGGVQGGISNGMDIYFRVAFKPVATIMQKQSTINAQGEKINLEMKGRHDPCVVPRAVPIVEAMASLVLADFLLRKRTNQL